MDHVTVSLLAKADLVRLRNSVKNADQLERIWMNRIEKAILKYTPQLIWDLTRKNEATAPDLEDLCCEQFFDVSIRAIKYAMMDTEPKSNLPRGAGSKMAGPPKQKIPDTLHELMKMYDLWRKKKAKPRRPVAIAKGLQSHYLKKVTSVWEKHSKEFREGDTATQKEVIRRVKDEAQTTTARARVIVRTETTNYYNKARKNFYDESEDITHYLFIAIRDAATSPWCSPLTLNGKRGRSGLVYAKTDPLCDAERPACHPGCRSEYLPLSNLNPAHLVFIHNLKIQRRENECYPLLKGWRSA